MRQLLSRGSQNNPESQKPDNSKTSPEGKLSGDDWPPIIGGTVGIGAFLVFIQAFSPNPVLPWTALLFAMACLAGGGLLGFLFGVPHSHQTGLAEPNPAAQADAESAQANVENAQANAGTAQANADSAQTNAKPRKLHYAANTNLEQISDWLTKILVGVTLTQLSDLPKKISEIGTYFGPTIGTGENNEELAVAIFILFTICGFLFGFLWTRLFLGREFALADLTIQIRDALVANQQKQDKIDAEALNSVNKYLGSLDIDEINIKSMKSYITRATAPYRVQIYYTTRDVSLEARKNKKELWKIKRVIPIFEALIDADKDNIYYKNYAEIGFALQDQTPPNYKTAIENFTKAIDLRDGIGENGYEEYEYNRAICNIMLDENLNQKKKSEPNIRDNIVADLNIAARKFDLSKSDTISKWMTLNDVSIDSEIT